MENYSIENNSSFYSDINLRKQNKLKLEKQMYSVKKLLCARGEPVFSKIRIMQSVGIWLACGVFKGMDVPIIAGNLLWTRGY